MEPGYLLVLLGIALLPDGTARCLGALAVVPAGLAIAGVRTGSSSAVTPGFLAVDGALVLMAIALAAGSALLALRHEPRGRTAAAAGVVGAGAMGLGWGARGILVAVPKVQCLIALAVIAALGLILFCTGRLVRLAPVRDDLGVPKSKAGIAVLLLGAAAAAAGFHFVLVLGGVILAAWAGYLLQRSGGGPRVPVVPLLTTLCLVPAGWLMATIAGPEGLAMSALPLLPLSPPAERLLAPAFLVVGWALAGLWPLHRHSPSTLLAAVGAILFVRVALPTMPAGVEHWRPVAMPLFVAGLWHAALAGRWPRVAVGMAWVGLLGSSREGVIGAALLFAAALTGELTRRAGARLGRWEVVERAALALAAGAGGLLAAESGLGAEVVYTLAAVGALVAAAGRASSQAMTASERRVTAPSA